MASFPNSLIAEASRAISRYAGHQRVLEAMALRLPLAQVLSRLVQSIEDAAPEMLGAVMLVDETGTRILTGAAPSLPAEYSIAVNGLSIGPSAGSCGTAAWRRARVIVNDIAADPLWVDYKQLALRHGLLACWSTPIVASDGRVLGSFAVYYKTARSPEPSEIRLVEDAVDLACIAIDQERAQNSERRSAAHYRAVVETAPSAIVGLDSEQRVTEWNRAATGLFGRDREQMMGKQFSLTCLSAEAAATFEQCFGASHAQRMQSVCETEINHVDGGKRWALWSMSPIFSSDGGDGGGLLAIAQDITDRREAEAALRSSETQLRHSQKMEAVGRLAGGIAHDFNNLLTVIHGNASLAIADAPKDSPQHVALDEVCDAAERATSLTRQLLTFSRREPVEPALLDVNEIVEEMRRMLGRLIGEHIQLETSLSPNAVVVKADRTNLEQLLLNLVVNGRDAMPDGGVLIVATMQVELGDEEAALRELTWGSYVKLSVTDTGTGMDENTHARAFEPFFTTKPAGEGTGLGLATVYAIATRHGGAVAIETQPGVGTTVSFWLPRIFEDAESTRKSDEHPVQIGSGTILIVEDEEAIRNLSRRVLVAHGFRVLEAANGEDALQVWGKHKREISVLITDVVMPKMGGPELVEKLRLERPELAVVYCSGYSDNMVLPASGEDVHTAFLGKPFTLHGLVDRVVRLTSIARPSSAPATT
ncbi:MAG: ATP-binding protein [Gemmatimonadaceae bacterium]